MDEQTVVADVVIEPAPAKRGPGRPKGSKTDPARKAASSRSSASSATSQPSGSSGSSASPSRKAKKPRKSLSEPSAAAVDSLYNLMVMLGGMAQVWMPERYHMTATDQEFIYKPLARMYLRRQELPVVSPDTQDMFILAVGVAGYVSHSIFGGSGGRAGYARGSYNPGPSAAHAAPGADRPWAAAPAGGTSRGYGPDGMGVPHGYGVDPTVTMAALHERVMEAAERTAAASNGST